MRNCEEVPFPIVHGCRLKAGSCRTIREFIRSACMDCLQGKKAYSGPTPRVHEISEKFQILSSREAELCSLLAHRLSTAEISACLLISPRTVEKHIESIFKKLEVGSREHLRLKMGIPAPAILSVDMRHSAHDKSTDQRP